MSYYNYSLIFCPQKASVAANFGLSYLDAFVDNEIETANSHFFAGEDSLMVDNGEYIVNESAFELTVKRGIGAHRGASVNLNEPGLEGFINHEIVTVQFEAVPTRKDVLLNCLERSNDDVFDLCEAPINPC